MVFIKYHSINYCICLRYCFTSCTVCTLYARKWHIRIRDVDGDEDDNSSDTIPLSSYVEYAAEWWHVVCCILSDVVASSARFQITNENEIYLRRKL